MGSRYPGRPRGSNFSHTINVRVIDTQKNRLEKYSEMYQMPISDIVREAIGMWLNSNEGDNHAVMVSQDR